MINPVRPAEIAVRDGLAYTLWMPEDRVPLAGGTPREILEGVYLPQITHLRSCKLGVEEDAPCVPDAQIADPLHIRIGKRMHQHTVDHTEDRNRRANAQRQREDRSQSKSRILDELPQ